MLVTSRNRFRPSASNGLTHTLDAVYSTILSTTLLHSTVTQTQPRKDPYSISSRLFILVKSTLEKRWTPSKTSAQQDDLQHSLRRMYFLLTIAPVRLLFTFPPSRQCQRTLETLQRRRNLSVSLQWLYREPRRRGRVGRLRVLSIRRTARARPSLYDRILPDLGRGDFEPVHDLPPGLTSLVSVFKHNVCG